MPKSVKEVLFNCAKRAQEELNEFEEGSAIHDFAARNWRVCEGLITAAGLMNEYDAFKGSETAPAWEDQEVAVVLTNAEWSRLTSYILMSTCFRNGELETWQNIAKEDPENKKAPEMVEWLREFNADIDRFRQLIDNR